MSAAPKSALSSGAGGPVQNGRRGRGGRAPGEPSPVDIHVGSRVRLRRTLLGMSQEKLGAACGLTFQQIQKYERGANRIGASRLYELSHILEVPVAFFFEGMPGKGHIQGHGPGLAEEGAEYEADVLSRRETLELIRAYYKIPDSQARKRVFELIKSMAGPDAP